MEWLLIILLSILGLLLFFKFRPKSYQSMLIDKQSAEQIAEQFIKRYVGVDVHNWKKYSMFWHDRDTVNKLHHMDLLNKNRQILYEWGLVEAWRIRFVSAHKSIIIGINANQEVTFLQVDVKRQDIPKINGEVQSPEHLLHSLNASTHGVWGNAFVTGNGKKEEDLNNTDLYWYTVESEEIRMKIAVEVQNGYLVSMGSAQEILTDKMNVAVKKEYLESTLNLSGVLGSFVAVIAALIILITQGGEVSLAYSLVMGCIMAAISSLTAKEDIELSIVNAYDSRISIKSVYLLGILSTALASLAAGFVVFIASLAGNFISTKKSLYLFEQLEWQSAVGVCVGIVTLGVFGLFFYILEKKNWLKISPELSDRTVYLSGFNLKQGLSVALQSSLAEETVYRLLAIPVIWWLSGNVYVAIGISSMLWAFLHQGTGYQPRWIRWFQLFVFGWILGFVYVYYGFVSVLVAHFVHNFILVSVPLFQYRYDKQRLHKQAKPQSIHNG
ncbi:CPBP family intramembrane glutamic endopeptidase [Paenibacillus sp. 481]|uniref:CPBP family intramembrane glutamic endopeptidase n=1 Tax=Paenibacillus sp. 481 TaxID=2835869 RepID=UPI001E54546F|nr:type II CAAX endopeptidase family protein [Paenibacillus sp. 481]UHA71980.1 CPBP family intramembrane metalloprotease [Paenibacillus sp. 481]